MKSLHVKEANADKVKNKKNDWFAKVPSHDKTNVAIRTLWLDVDIRLVRKTQARPWKGIWTESIANLEFTIKTERINYFEKQSGSYL